MNKYVCSFKENMGGKRVSNVNFIGFLAAHASFLVLL